VVWPFVLCSSRHSRHLPSFPTRRSSDLASLTSLPRALAIAFFSDPRWSIAAAEIIPCSLAIALMPRTLPRARRTFGRVSVVVIRSEEHTSELQSPYDLVCRLLLEKKKQT